jgi:phage-related protein
MTRKAVFLGDTKRIIREFPDGARREAGFQIRRVELGLEPNDCKPFSSIGPGVREIRIRERGGAFRVIYQATLPDAVLVLSAFQKKAQNTPQYEIEKARDRLKAYLKERGRE